MKKELKAKASIRKILFTSIFISIILNIIIMVFILNETQILTNFANIANVKVFFIILPISYLFVLMMSLGTFLLYEDPPKKKSSKKWKPNKNSIFKLSWYPESTRVYAFYLLSLWYTKINIRKEDSLWKKQLLYLLL